MQAPGFNDYQWSNGASTQSIFIPIQGHDAIKVWVQVTDVKGCNNADTVIINIATSVYNRNNSGDFVVFPDPSRGIFKIENKIANISPYEIKVMNALGEVVFSKTIKNNENDLMIDLSYHPKGIYYLLIKVKTGVTLLPLIIR